VVTAIIYPYVGNGPGSRFAPGYWYVLNPTNNSSEFWIFGGLDFDPQERTATACSATCGDTCLTP